MARITGIAFFTCVFVVSSSNASSDFRITSDALRLGRSLPRYGDVGRNGGLVESDIVREINKNDDGGFVPIVGYRQSKGLSTPMLYSSHISQPVSSPNYLNQQLNSRISNRQFRASHFNEPQTISTHTDTTSQQNSTSPIINNTESNSARSSSRSRGFRPSPTSYPDELSVVPSPRFNSRSIEQKVLYKLAGQHTTTRASNLPHEVQLSDDEEEEEDDEEETSEEESGDEESEEGAITTQLSTDTDPAVDIESKAKRKTRGKKIKKLKGLKKFKKYLLPLVIAYKLKFIMLVPLLLAGLILLVGTTGFAGFFFALFAVGISLRRE